MHRLVAHILQLTVQIRHLRLMLQLCSLYMFSSDKTIECISNLLNVSITFLLLQI